MDSTTMPGIKGQNLEGDHQAQKRKRVRFSSPVSDNNNDDGERASKRVRNESVVFEDGDLSEEYLARWTPVLDEIPMHKRLHTVNKYERALDHVKRQVRKCREQSEDALAKIRDIYYAAEHHLEVIHTNIQGLDRVGVALQNQLDNILGHTDQESSLQTRFPGSDRNKDVSEGEDSIMLDNNVFDALDNHAKTQTDATPNSLPLENTSRESTVPATQSIDFDHLTTFAETRLPM